MAIKRLYVKNFKSFKELDVELGKFNVLIGPNASGKSNFVHIFKFLRDIAKHGIDNAVSMQGGVKYLRNMKIGSSEDLKISVDFDEEIRKFHELSIEKNNKKYFIKFKNIKRYEFIMKFKKRGDGFKSIKETVRIKCEFLNEKHEKIGSGEVVYSLIDGKFKEKLNNKPDEFPEINSLLIPISDSLPKHITLLQIAPLIPPMLPIYEYISNIGIYDIDPKLSKMATQITGKIELEEDGSNLPIVLRNIIASKDKKRKLYNLINDLLPYVHDLKVEKFEDKSLFFKLKESYFENKYIPASLISDGTINITALIIAMYFEKKPLTIIEEPERNIHPYLISRIVNRMKEVSSHRKQIIVTTHNPEMVKYAGLDNILIVTRDKDGFSTISRPNKEKIEIFLKNDIGIEELYVKNILGALK